MNERFVPDILVQARKERSRDFRFHDHRLISLAIPMAPTYGTRMNCEWRAS